MLLSLPQKWDDLRQADVAKALLPRLSTVAIRARRYMKGDYWHAGEAWAGTRVPKTVENRVEKEAELARTFTPSPLIQECVERFIAGLLSSEPATEFVLERPLAEGETPTPEEQKVLDEINAALAEWWDSRGAQELLQEFARELATTGHSALRFFVPSGKLKKQGDGWELGTKDWRKALDAIYWHVPLSEDCTTLLHPKTMQPISIFSYKELVLSEENDTSTGVSDQRVEVSFVREDNKTVIRILGPDNSAQTPQSGIERNAEQEAVQETGGELYVASARMPALITDAVQRSQNALNVINTMLLHNGNLAGFRERNFFNVQRPTVRIPDSTQPKGYREEPAPLNVGPGTANYHAGFVYEDSDGKQKIATGSLVITDPVDPSPLIAAKEQYETSLYRAFDQMHVLISGDATASAVSRVQARAAFVLRLQKAKPKIEAALRSQLRGIMILAAHLAGDEERVKAFSALRCRVDCHLSAGPLAPDEREAILREYNAGVLSLQTTQLLLGVEDVDGEAKRLTSQTQISLTDLIKRAQVLQTLTAGGASVRAAAFVAGFTSDQIKELERSDFVEEENNNGQ